MSHSAIDDTIKSDFKAFEDLLVRGSKRFTRGLLSAVAALLLAFLLLTGVSGPSVNIPWFDVEVPTFLAVLLFLLGSTAFGIAAAFYIWRCTKFMNTMIEQLWLVDQGDDSQEMREYYRSRLRAKLGATFLRASPLNTSIIVLGLATLGAYILHVLTFWCWFAHASRIDSSGDYNWLSTWWGSLVISSAYGVFLTAVPFGLAFFAGVAFLHSFREVQRRLS